MRSLEEYLIKEYKHDQKRIIAEGQHEYIEKMKAEDKIKQRAMNDLWNNKCADAREKRLAAERATTRENIEKHIEERELADAEKLELIENVVRYEKVSCIDISGSVVFRLNIPSFKMSVHFHS